MIKFTRLGVDYPLEPGELFLQVKVEHPERHEGFIEYWLAYDPEKIKDPVGIFIALAPGSPDSFIDFIEGDTNDLEGAGFRFIGECSLPAVEVTGVFQ